MRKKPTEPKRDEKLCRKKREWRHWAIDHSREGQCLWGSLDS